MTYTTVEIVGDNDSLLEQGELAQIDIDMTAECGCTITENETFTLELKPPTGSYLVVQRTTPASVNESIINLN
jgi:archaellin